MKLYRALGIDLDDREVISIAGGGGKTTAMFTLAKELSELGRRVLVTTTTAIMMPESEQYDTFLNLSNEGDIDKLFDVEPGSVTVLIGEFIRIDKLKGIDEELVDKIYERCYFDNIIVEADGSRMLPIKAPREDEPLLPSATKKLLGVIGLDAVGKKVDGETVHRLELFKGVTGAHDGDTIDSEIISKLILHEKGLFKGSETSDVIENYLLLNKADDEKLKREARKIAKSVSGKGRIKEIIISSLKEGKLEVW